MESRIQFRIDEETKKLAQDFARSEGKTLSDACRELALEMASKQKKKMAHSEWLSNQVNEAFEKYESGKSVFLDEESALLEMEKFKQSLNHSNKS